MLQCFCVDKNTQLHTVTLSMVVVRHIERHGVAASLMVPFSNAEKLFNKVLLIMHLSCCEVETMKVVSVLYYIMLHTFVMLYMLD